METLAWLCLFLPLAGVVVLTLAGGRASRARAAAWAGTAIAFASFVCAAAVFVSMLGEGASRARHVYTLYTWAGSADVQGAALDPGRPAVGDRDADRRPASAR